MKNKGKCISKVTLTGGKIAGWVIEISDNYNFKDDIAITNEEAILLRDLLMKKVGDKPLKKKVVE